LSNSDNFNVYPNPSNGSISVDTRFPLAEIVVCDIAGNQILRTTSSDFHAQFTIAKAGFYFVTVNTANGSSTKKLLVTEN
jgi:hypothetical protein